MTIKGSTVAKALLGAGSVGGSVGAPLGVEIMNRDEKLEENKREIEKLNKALEDSQSLSEDLQKDVSVYAELNDRYQTMWENNPEEVNFQRQLNEVEK